MDRQSGPVQLEPSPPITQGLQHIATEPPAWAESAGRVIHYLMTDFGGGRRWLKLAWEINFQKLATIPYLPSLSSSTRTSVLRPAFMRQCRVATDWYGSFMDH